MLLWSKNNRHRFATGFRKLLGRGSPPQSIRHCFRRNKNDNPFANRSSRVLSNNMHQISFPGYLWECSIVLEIPLFSMSSSKPLFRLTAVFMKRFHCPHKIILAYGYLEFVGYFFAIDKEVYGDFSSHKRLSPSHFLHQSSFEDCLSKFKRSFALDRVRVL